MESKTNMKHQLAIIEKYQKKKKVQGCLKGVKHQSTLPMTHSHPTEKEMVGI